MDKYALENFDPSTMLEGALPLLVLEAMSEKILPNIYDIRADPKKPRSVSVEIEFLPTKDKFGNITGANVVIKEPKVKLSPRGPQIGHILLGKVGDEGFQAKEIKQMNVSESVDGDDDNEPSKTLKAVK